MKINNMIAFCVSVLMVLSGCNKYDDSALWDDIDKSYNQLTEIKAQLESLTARVDMLSAVVTGGAITGITANVLGPALCRLFRLEDEVARGAAFGTSGHVIGTAKATELSPLTGAVSSLSLVVAGLLTAIVLPILANFI